MRPPYGISLPIVRTSFLFPPNTRAQWWWCRQCRNTTVRPRSSFLHTIPAVVTIPSSDSLPTQSRGYVIGIESTCDDAGVAILSHSLRSNSTTPTTTIGTSSSSPVHIQDNLVRIEGEAVASEQRMLEQFGGVVPLVAAEAHKQNLPSLLRRCIHQASLLSEDKVGFVSERITRSKDNPFSLTKLTPTAIAVAAGPGLALCLRTGVQVASSLSIAIDRPLVPVHHLEAHLLMPRMNNQQTLTFPYLALIISGGHTALYIVCGIGRYIHLGETLDDAVGEAFDKVGRLLVQNSTEKQTSTSSTIDNTKVNVVSSPPVVHYGAVLEKLANQSNHQLKYTLPKPLSSSSSTVVTQIKQYRQKIVSEPLRLPGLIGEECINPWRVDLPITVFSVSGLKSAVNRLVTQEKNKNMINKPFLTAEQTNNIAYRFQQTIVDHVMDQIIVALEYCIQQGRLPNSVLYGYGTHKPLPFVISGGVAANSYLRQQLIGLEERYRSHHVQVHIPPSRLCVDNGVMIAYAALEMLAIDHEQIFTKLHHNQKGKLIFRRKNNNTKDNTLGGNTSVHEAMNPNDDYKYIFDPRWKLGTHIEGWDT